MNEARDAWRAQLGDELRFWDQYITTRGLKWPDEFTQRIDPDAPLTERAIITRIDPRQRRVRILDVGAGPLTVLGKRLPGVTLEITAVDPLATQYNEILDRCGVVPPVRTSWCEGENLAATFQHDSFDFAYARNALDHAYDPQAIIAQMVTLVRPGGWVILRHRPNEAETARYQGLHQWNFDADDRGRFRVRGCGGSAAHDLSEELNRVASVRCCRDGSWLVCAIRKRTPLRRAVHDLAHRLARTIAPRRARLHSPATDGPLRDPDQWPARAAPPPGVAAD